MLKNYLTTALRILREQRTHSIINIAGLSVGITIFILISSYIWFELSFDRFHSKADQIYRVVQSYSQGDKEHHVSITGNLLAQALQDEFPEIIHISRLGSWATIELHYEDNISIIKRRKEYLRADPAILDVFDIDLIKGDPATALTEPNSLILTEELARELFGTDDPIGNTITITRANSQEEAFNNPNTEFTVTGIARAMPQNSHFEFSLIIPYGEDWEDSYSQSPLGTYITIPKDYPPERLEKKFPSVVRKYLGPEFEKRHGTSFDDYVNSGGFHRLHLQPLSDIYMDSFYTEDCVSSRRGNKRYVYILSVIAFFILLLACLNFIIMTTARSASRAKEVGLRKIAGASRMQLISQFLSESVLLSILALMLSVPPVRLLWPVFNHLVGTQIPFNFSSAGFFLVILVVITMIVGILAGSYPAFLLSAFKPVSVLKGGIHERRKGLSLRNGLIVFQLIISTTLMAASLVIYNQIYFMRNKDPGFDQENILVIRNAAAILHSKGISRTAEGFEFYREQRFLIPQTFKQELLINPHILNVSVARPVPNGSGFNWWVDCHPENTGLNENFQIRWIGADPDFIDTYGLKLIGGRNFYTIISPMEPASPEGIIVNETAAKYFGWEEPLGKRLTYHGTVITWSEDGKPNYTYVDVEAKVIGVIQDFHFKSLHSEIEPLGIWPGGSDVISVKIQPDYLPAALEFIEKTWNSFAPGIPINYYFLTEERALLYGKEERLGKIFLYFTILAIIIACLGLFGLSAYTSEQRTKEIAVRKVMGASILEIIRLLLRFYIILILIAYIIAWPLCYIVMQKWLQNFAYRATPGIGMVLLTGLIALVVVMMAVNSHAIKVSLTNPAESLRYE